VTADAEGVEEAIADEVVGEAEEVADGAEVVVDGVRGNCRVLLMRCFLRGCNIRRL